ncbi:competence protein ComK [Oceanobacillus piezotolerans]|nr:competence protein ComK [Oceanobacillus piezotolerans]
MKRLYTITEETKIIRKNDSAYYRSHIIETTKEEPSPYSPTQIINLNCKKYGSTLDGRKEVVSDILKSSSKLPIPVVPQRGIFMIPTASVTSEKCIWVSYHQIKDYDESDDKTIIFFQDGTSTFLNVTPNIFDNQFKRSSQVVVHFFRHTIFGEGPTRW